MIVGNAYFADCAAALSSVSSIQRRVQSSWYSGLVVYLPGYAESPPIVPGLLGIALISEGFIIFPVNIRYFLRGNQLLPEIGEGVRAHSVSEDNAVNNRIMGSLGIAVDTVDEIIKLIVISEVAAGAETGLAGIAAGRQRQQQGRAKYEHGKSFHSLLLILTGEWLPEPHTGTFAGF